jgi:hypothetical protein
MGHSKNARSSKNKKSPWKKERQKQIRELSNTENESFYLHGHVSEVSFLEACGSIEIRRSSFAKRSTQFMVTNIENKLEATKKERVAQMRPMGFFDGALEGTKKKKKIARMREAHNWPGSVGVGQERHLPGEPPC